MRGRWGRFAATTACVGSLLLAAGCSIPAGAAPPVSQWPAGASGRLCQVLEYDKVEATIGVRFDTAGGGHESDTMTCALTEAANPFPYLTLAVSPSTVDKLLFVATVQPAGSVAVGGLGASAYSLPLAPADGSGPGLELCWITGEGRMMLLHYIFASGATDAEVTALTPKLVTLAQQLTVSIVTTTGPSPLVP